MENRFQLKDLPSKRNWYVKKAEEVLDHGQGKTVVW